MFALGSLGSLGFACNACKGHGDKQTDTVTVTFINEPHDDASDKENAPPNLANGKGSGKFPEVEVVERRFGTEVSQIKPDPAELFKRKKVEEQQERLRHQQLERQRTMEEERRRQRLDQEERRRRQEELRAREQEVLRRRRMEDAERRAEEAKKQLELKDFLSKNGFYSTNEGKQKKTGVLSSGFLFPLHVAVRNADAKAVEVLLWGGADRSVTDSAKLTPLALALKLDKKASHKAVIELLSR